MGVVIVPNVTIGVVFEVLPSTAPVGATVLTGAAGAGLGGAWLFNSKSAVSGVEGPGVLAAPFLGTAETLDTELVELGTKLAEYPV